MANKIDTLNLDTIENDLRDYFETRYHELQGNPEAQREMEAAYDMAQPITAALLAMLRKAMEQTDFVIDEHKDLQQRYKVLNQIVRRHTGEMALQSRASKHPLTADDVQVVLDVLNNGHALLKQAGNDNPLQDLYKAMTDVANAVIAAELYESLVEKTDEGA